MHRVFAADYFLKTEKTELKPAILTPFATKFVPISPQMLYLV